jgi:hypothetical protein
MFNIGGGGAPPAPPIPALPSAPANPPLFGSQFAAANRVRQQAMASSGFGSTILGGANPTNTGQKTLLGA